MAISDPRKKPQWANINGTSGDDPNIQGTNGDDVIHGLEGNDVIFGNQGNDQIFGDEGNDTLNGGGQSGDELYGGDGNDNLVNGAGLMVGGLGNDNYFIGNNFGNVTIIENNGEGFDSLFTSVSYTLPDNVSIEALSLYNVPNGSQLLVLNGNNAGNIITGSAQPLGDTLNGNGGSDEIFGGGGLDRLNGGSGDDIIHSAGEVSNITGGTGSDTFYVNIYDVVHENAGEGSDRILSATGFHLLEGDEVEILEAADINATTRISFSGNSGDSIIRGNAGANSLYGRGGTDFLYGNGGDDILDGGTGNDQLEGGAGIDYFAFTTAIGSNNIDTVTDFLVGTDKIVLSRDVFTTLAAGALPAGAFRTGSAAGDADDRIIYDSATGALRYDADGNGAGAAIQFATLQAGLALSAADFLVVNGTAIVNGAPDAPVNQDGTFARDYLMGGSGNDTLRGGDGSDTLVGGAGDDVLTGGGLPGGETGIGFNDALFGEDGNDILDGGLGADRMYGGRGDDIYFVDNNGASSDLGSNTGDVIVEYAGEGTDTLNVSVGFTVSDSQSIEIINSSSQFQAVYGNSFDNIMSGHLIFGMGGNDQMIGTSQDNDALNGGSGNDILNGDIGADLLIGGTGDDTYIVDNTGDFIIEATGEGVDRVIASISYAVAANAEIEFIETNNAASAAAFNLTGSDSNNTITGNEGVNILDGGAGNDILNGAGGDDYLVGGTGADTMAGGTGNDNYYVDNVGDVIVETSGQGSDRIATLVSYTLTDAMSVEIMEVTNSTSTNAQDLTGNNQDNVLAGNNGTNVLNGGGGNDTLAGYAGNDTLNGGDGNDTLIGGLGNDQMNGGIGNDKYYVEDAGDLIGEAVGAGFDTAATNTNWTLNAGAEVERLEPITFGSTQALDITGNEFANSIVGNNGANILNGGAGNDTLEGLGGQDFFAFTTALGPNNIDRIYDYLSSFDRFMLDHNIFTGLTPGGLGANQFVSGPAAADADDRIIYNPATGAVLFDADGNGAGAAIQFATLNTGLNITAGDFLVI